MKSASAGAARAHPHQPARRRALCAGLGLALALPLAAPAQTAAYPAKPVKVIVAFTAGGTTDLLARSVSQKLSEKLGSRS